MHVCVSFQKHGLLRTLVLLWTKPGLGICSYALLLLSSFALGSYALVPFLQRARRTNHSLHSLLKEHKSNLLIMKEQFALFEGGLCSFFLFSCWSIPVGLVGVKQNCCVLLYSDEDRWALNCSSPSLRSLQKEQKEWFALLKEQKSN